MERKRHEEVSKDRSAVHGGWCLLWRGYLAYLAFLRWHVLKPNVEGATCYYHSFVSREHQVGRCAGLLRRLRLPVVPNLPTGKGIHFHSWAVLQTVWSVVHCTRWWYVSRYARSWHIFVRSSG